MNFQLFQQVALAADIPEKGLCQGDVATIVEHHPVRSGEDGYSLELFNALGETLRVITVFASDIQQLTSAEIFNVRPLAAAD